MLEGLLLFAIAFGASLLGSLQAGPVNLAVLHTTLRRGQRAGLRVAVGGSLPELLYAVLAAAGGDWLGLMNNSPVLAGITALVLLAAGAWLLRNAARPSSTPSPPPAPEGYFLGRGLLLGLLNPQLLAFWGLVWLNADPGFARSAGWPAWLAFGLGAAAGAFTLLLGVIKLAELLRATLAKWPPGRLDRWLGLLLLVLGVLQMAQLLVHHAGWHLSDT